MVLSDTDDQSSTVLSSYSRANTDRGGMTGSYGHLNKLVVWWTTVMILTILTILSYFTMALISDVQSGGAWDETDNADEASGEDGGRRGRRYLEDGGGDDDAAAGDDANQDDDGGNNAGDDAAGDDQGGAADDYNYNGDDGNGNNGDDGMNGEYNADDDGAAAAAANDDEFADYYMGDDVADVTDDGNANAWANEEQDGPNFSFNLTGTEIYFLLFLLVSVIALDYYGLEALKELGNKAARFRVGAFAAFVLMLSNITFIVAMLLGLSKSSGSFGGGFEESSANAVAIFFLVMTTLYLFFGVMLYKSETSSLVSSDRREPLIEESKRETSNNLFKFWISIVIVSAALLVTSYSVSRSVTPAHQNHWKYHLALAWSALLIIVFAAVGWVALRARGRSTKLLIGSFFGGLVGLSCLFLGFFFFFAPFAYDKERDAGVVTTAETVFSFISLLLSIIHAAFSHAVYTYRHSIIRANAADSGLPTASPSTYLT